MIDETILPTAITNKTIAIIGGGPGGLTLARLLQLRGADVKVYERDTHRSVRVQGATLDLHYDSGLKALEAAGLIPAFEANYRPGADLLCITDKAGNVLMRDTESVKGEYARPEIDRGPLRDILLDSLKPGTIVWDSKFASIEKVVDGRWRISFENGTTATADIVVGADGANSMVRPYLTPIKPFFVGMTALEGAVYEAAVKAPRIHEMLNGGKIFTLGDSRTLIISSKGDGSVNFYVGFKSEENWAQTVGLDFKDPQQIAEWFKEEFSGWDAIWLELFENSEPNFIPRPQYCMPLDQMWPAQDGLTLIGDAAHLMPPYAGEGVNMAMLDALELADSLTHPQFHSIKDAIEHYELNMCKRASEVADVTLQQTELMHSPGGLENMLTFFGA